MTASARMNPAVDPASMAGPAAESPVGAVPRKACHHARPLEQEEARMMPPVAPPWPLLVGACMEDTAAPAASSAANMQTREAAAAPAVAVVPWLLQRGAQGKPAGCAAGARWDPKGTAGGRRCCYSNCPS